MLTQKLIQGDLNFPHINYMSHAQEPYIYIHYISQYINVIEFTDVANLYICIPHKEISVGGKQDAKVTLTTHSP